MGWAIVTATALSVAPLLELAKWLVRAGAGNDKPEQAADILSSEHLSVHEPTDVDWLPRACRSSTRGLTFGRTSRSTWRFSKRAISTARSRHRTASPASRLGCGPHLSLRIKAARRRATGSGSRGTSESPTRSRRRPGSIPAIRRPSSTASSRSGGSARSRP